MAAIAHQRCFNHGSREAVARCPECRQFFCRECVTEHDEQVVCAPCLKKLAQSPSHASTPFSRMLSLAQCFLGILTVWLFFYFLGQGLLLLPSSFHEGTVWQQGVLSDE
jgi:uncharacterized paraquat-inducible protein A